MKPRLWILVFVLMISTSALAGAEDQNSVVEAKVSCGDLLDITVFEVPELTQSVRVTNLGAVEVPLIGSVPADGRTTTELSDAIKTKLIEHQLVRRPVVSVFIKESSAQTVSVLGEVHRPGVYPLHGPRRLLDLLAEAGGTESTASEEISVQRRGSTEIQTLKMSAISAGATLQNNLFLAAGDTVVVSRASVVYVVGDVTRAGGYTMQNDGHLSLLQAIALAGGVTRTASIRGAKVIRRSANGYVQEPLELDRVLEGKKDDVAMQANDVIFIPNSAAKSATKRTLDSILQIATGVAIYSSRPY